MKNKSITEAVHTFVRLYLLALTLIFSGPVACQRGISVFTGARSKALGEIIASIDGQEALSTNFSNVAWHKYNKTFFMLGSSLRFGLSEFKSSFAGVCIKVKTYSHLSFSVSQYGFSSFNLNQFALAYARKIHPNLSLSLKMIVESLNIPGYGNNHRPAISLGLSGKVAQNTGYAILIENPETLTIDEISRTQSRMSIGIFRLQSEYLKMFLECEKSPAKAFIFKTGIEYYLKDFIQFQLGVNTHPGTMSFGMSFQTGNCWKISLSSQYSLETGINPAASVIWQKP